MNEFLKLDAAGLLTPSHGDVLGASLKHVYRIGDNAGFEDLLCALDNRRLDDVARRAPR